MRAEPRSTLMDLESPLPAPTHARDLVEPLARLSAAAWAMDDAGTITAVGGEALPALGMDAACVGNLAEFALPFVPDEPGRDVAWALVRAREAGGATFAVSTARRAFDVVLKRCEDGFIGWAIEVTEARRTQGELEHRARHDALTDLPNRTTLLTTLDHIVARARRRQQVAAVLFLDLDNFKSVNDSFGHVVGDELLVGVAARLRRVVRSADTVARHGGDEFVVVLDDVDDADRAMESAQRILDAFAAPFTISVGTHYAAPSIGVAFYPYDAATPHDLLRAADAAMYRAKEQGGGIQLFTPQMHRAAMRQFEFAQGLRAAVDAMGIEPWYQTIHAAIDGRVIAVEALARCNVPGHDDVTTTEMIRTAEETNCVGALGQQILEKAARHARAWSLDGVALDAICVNVSGRQLTERAFVRRVAELLVREHLPANRLEFELTEEAMDSGGEELLAIVHQLRYAGVRFAIDDFGTGRASLATLGRIPSDTIKIDPSIVADLDGAATPAIVEGIVGIAHALGKRVVAEGVETARQADTLRRLGCDALQGWHFSAAADALTVAPALPRRA